MSCASFVAAASVSSVVEAKAKGFLCWNPEGLTGEKANVHGTLLASVSRVASFSDRVAMASKVMCNFTVLCIQDFAEIIRDDEQTNKK